jgi:hypothetical protein
MGYSLGLPLTMGVFGKSALTSELRSRRLSEVAPVRAPGFQHADNGPRLFVWPGSVRDALSALSTRPGAAVLSRSRAGTTK